MNLRLSTMILPPGANPHHTQEEVTEYQSTVHGLAQGIALVSGNLSVGAKAKVIGTYGGHTVFDFRAYGHEPLSVGILETDAYTIGTYSAELLARVLKDNLPSMVPTEAEIRQEVAAQGSGKPLTSWDFTFRCFLLSVCHMRYWQLRFYSLRKGDAGKDTAYDHSRRWEVRTDMLIRRLGLPTNPVQKGLDL